MSDWLAKIAAALPIVEERMKPLQDEGIVTRINFSAAKWGYEPYRPTIRISVAGTLNEWMRHSIEIEKLLEDLEVGIDVAHV